MEMRPKVAIEDREEGQRKTHEEKRVWRYVWLLLTHAHTYAHIPHHTSSRYARCNSPLDNDKMK